MLKKLVFVKKNPAKITVSGLIGFSHGESLGL
jgi:hypothetical protein